MSRILAIFLFLIFAVSSLMSQAPQSSRPEAEGGEYGPAGAAMIPPPSNFNYIVPLPSSKSLSTVELAGKKLFIQRCSVCHLPGNPAYPAVAPILDGKLLTTVGDAAVRQQIMRGSARMPGFQYVFEPADIDKIVGYLKLLAYDPAAKKYAYASLKK